MHRRRKNPATVAAKLVTFPAIVLTPVPTLAPEPESLPVALVPELTPVAVAAARSVTNAASSAILLVIAMKVAEAGTVAATRARATAAMAVEEALVVPEEGDKHRLAILVAATVTCPVIALRGRNATTVSIRIPSSEHFKY